MHESHQSKPDSAQLDDMIAMVQAIMRRYWPGAPWGTITIHLDDVEDVVIPVRRPQPCAGRGGAGSTLVT